MTPRNGTTTSAFAAPARRRLFARALRSVSPCSAEPLPRATARSAAPGDPSEPASRLPVVRPRRGRWTYRAATSLVSLALLLLAAACGGPGALPPSAASPALGETHSFDLPSNTGDLITVPQPSAKLTIVDAFAPTCAPCREKVPALLAERDALAASGAKVVLVAVLADGESDADAARALASWGASAPFLVDRGGVLRRELAVDALPATVVVDQTGKVRWVAPVEATVEDVVAAARALAASPP